MGYVYLKLGSHSIDDGLTQNVIELKANSVSISVSKTIPSFEIPLSAYATGESQTLALDIGMASKTVSVSGIILDQQINQTHGGEENDRTFTAHEVAQIIASGVDSSFLQTNQRMNELVVLMPSFVDSNYVQRGGINTADRETGTLVPFTFAARGGGNELDNIGTGRPISSFPDSSTDTGLTGFIRTFSCDMSSEAYELSFSLEFETAIIVP
tara:strand:+ start:1399 stop:2034 length:636 start_codon:yes stop_codon:yes gene_type:complete